jgi:hypothetical protein
METWFVSIDANIYCQYLLISEKGGCCSEGQTGLIIPMRLSEDVNRRRTDNRMTKRKRTNNNLQNMTQKDKDRGTRTHWKNREWTEMPKKGKQFLLHMWQPSCYSCYKPSEKTGFVLWKYVCTSWIYRHQNGLGIDTVHSNVYDILINKLIYIVLVYHTRIQSRKTETDKTEFSKINK